MPVAPADTPVTTPVVPPTVATSVLPLLHTPPLVTSLSVVVEPAQTTVTPVTAAGIGLTVIGVTTKQPVGIVYVIFGKPDATPVTVPVLEPTVASVISLLLHKPPESDSLNVVVNVTQTAGVPVVAAGVGFTVMT